MTRLTKYEEKKFRALLERVEKDDGWPKLDKKKVVLPDIKGAVADSSRASSPKGSVAGGGDRAPSTSGGRSVRKKDIHFMKKLQNMMPAESVSRLDS